MDRDRPVSDRQARRIGIARAISKAGHCSRSDAARLVEEGRVALNGRPVRDAEQAVDPGRDRIEIDGRPLVAVVRHYVALNKPRGLVTTARDEQGRDTVYRCFDGSGLPWLAPVGRLDRASEGLLLFSNDPEWAARITDPDTGPDKTYHVQVDTIPDADLLGRLARGRHDGGEHLAAKQARLLLTGTRNAWLEIVLDEGRNRQIRRLLASFDVAVLRLVRVGIGPLALGELAKGQWRALERAEVDGLVRASPAVLVAPPR
jgi:23S rRNA pseudouridine2605 synthase